MLRPLERLLGVRSIDEAAPELRAIEGHVVVVGYGLSGRLLAKALKGCGVAHLVLEVNAESVRKAHASDSPVWYGDATSPEVLAHARLEHALALVLMINDPDAARRAVATAKHVAPQVPVLVRTRYLVDEPALTRMGADVTVVEELEAGLEMMARVLRRIGLPRNLIAEQVRGARETTQATERRFTLPRQRLAEIADLTELKIESFLVRETAYAAGRTVIELQLRSRTGALLVAVRRDGTLVSELDPSESLRAGDLLFLVGSGGALRSAIDLLEAGRDAPTEVPTPARAG
jgi:CPA2 family monovalent cation:H+ antiporter-2